MSAIWIGAMCVVAALLVTYWLGYRVGARITPDPDAVREYLDAQLGLEELHLAERRIRVQMLKADRDSAPNPRAGQPARVSSIQVTR